MGFPPPQRICDRADVRPRNRLGAQRSRRGGCELQTRRRRYQLGAPVVFRDEDATDMPAFIRFMLRKVIKAPEFLRLDIVSQLATAR